MTHASGTAATLAQTGNADHIAVACDFCERVGVVTNWRHLRLTGWQVATVTRLVKKRLVRERVAEGANVCEGCPMAQSYPTTGGRT